MASIPGGVSDKLGNEYERLWTIHNLVFLITGKAASVVVEPLGFDERGIEFWIVMKDGTHEGHQCKRENGSKGDWTASTLNEQGVLTNAKVQLNRDPSHRFVFVSGDKATLLGDLAERARRGDTTELFLKHAATTSAKIQQELQNLCRHLNYDIARTADAEGIRDFLRRVRFIVKDKSTLRSEVEDLVAAWVSGDPTVVVTHLEAFISRNEVFGKTLTEVDLIGALPSGCRPRDLGKDATLHTKLTDINQRFRASYCHLLIDGKPLGRPESDQLEQMLLAEQGERLILTHGSGGVGKSGVAFELEHRLEQCRVPHLALRLDRDKPGNTPGRFADTLELPGSPVACLAAAAAGKRAVLILDQIDAIRWTAAHSAYAWESCERLVAEAMRYDNLRVVVLCRTFDAEDDQRIKEWHQRVKATKFCVGLLEEQFVKEHFQRHGMNVAGLTASQLATLRSPQSLYLWSRLRNESPQPSTFRTTTDLMRLFWEMVRKRLRDLPVGDYETVVTKVVEYMDKRGQLDAPRSIVAAYPSEIAALKSLGVFAESDGPRILFAHQSYLDHLTAERVLTQIHQADVTVTDWLKRDEQSLFRRGQLRQLLTLLCDEDSVLYVKTLRELIVQDGVRFHLRHLALQMLGHAHQPSTQEIELALELFETEQWREHVWGQVFRGRPAWFVALYDHGTIHGWLQHNDSNRNRWAAMLAARVVVPCQEKVERLIAESGLQPQIQTVLEFADPLQLQPVLLGEYLRLVAQGSVGDYTDWKAVLEGSPERTIQLLKARIENIVSCHVEINQDNRSEPAARELIPGLTAYARKDYLKVWADFLPLLERLASKTQELHRQMAKGELSSSGYDEMRIVKGYSRLAERIAIAAGHEMADRETNRFFEIVKGRAGGGCKTIERVIAESVSGAPTVRGDQALSWLVSRVLRFRCGRRGGSRGYACEYIPARNLIRRFASSASAPIVAKLISSILAHRPEREIEDFRWAHKHFMGESIYGNGARGHIVERSLFLGQYMLLSAVPRCFLDSDVRDWVGVLGRKFGPARNSLRRRRRHTGGWVGSTIPADRLPLISDRQWLQNVTADWTRKGSSFKAMGPGSIGEVGHEHFARDIGTMARREPERFARWGMLLPVNIDGRYISSLLNAFAETSPPQKTPEFDQWQPAPVQLVEQFMDRIATRLQEREIASAFCWVLNRRASESWSELILRKVAELAVGHADPRVDEYTVFSGAPNEPTKFSQRDVVHMALNCVRGQAVGVIEHSLFEHPDTFEFFEDVIPRILRDPHPAVRVAAIGMALPLLNRDRATAVQTVLQICNMPDDEILRSGRLSEFLSYTLATYSSALSPLLRRMVGSSIEEVQKQGAQWVTALWVRGVPVDGLFESCWRGTSVQRKGVATVLAREVANGAQSPDAAEKLQECLNDEEQVVRNEAAMAFRNADLYARADAASLTSSFVESRAVNGNVDDMLFGLKRTNRPLRPFYQSLWKITELMTRQMADAARNPSTSSPMHADLLGDLLLRLYEQADNDAAIRKVCLDAWDKLIEQRAGFDLLRKIDE